MQIVSANHLADGTVIFLTGQAVGEYGWTRHQDQASVAETQEDADRLLAAAERLERETQEATGSYLVDVKREGFHLRATKYREHIRAEGPSIPFGHDEQRRTEDAA